MVYSWAGTRPNRNRHVPDLSDFAAEDLADSAGPAPPLPLFALRYHAVPETRSGVSITSGTPARAESSAAFFRVRRRMELEISLPDITRSRDRTMSGATSPPRAVGFARCFWARADGPSSFVGGELGLERDGKDHRMGREADQEYGLSATSEVRART